MADGTGQQALASIQPNWDVLDARDAKIGNVSEIGRTISS